jgi:peptidoglycan-associated lipoprotein
MSTKMGIAAVFAALALCSTNAFADDEGTDEESQKTSDADAPRTEDEAAPAQTDTKRAAASDSDKNEFSMEDHVLESSVYFTFDKSDLEPQAQETLTAAAEWLEKNPTAMIVIEGHADKVGDVAYNKQLAEARANASKDFLVSQGVDPERVKVIAYGEAMPVVDSEDAEPQNRRILIVAVHKNPIIKTKVIEKTVNVPVNHVQYVERRVDVPVIVEKEPENAYEFDIVGGGGVLGNMDSDATDRTSVGGMWNARVTLNTRYHIGVEAAYVGSYQDLADDMGYSDSKLIGNGVEGGLRVNILQERVRPYVFGGIGYNHYNVTNNNDLSDDQVTVPGGAGIDFKVTEGLLIDVRGTARAAFEDELFAEPGEDIRMHNWSASAQAGYAF